MRQTLRVAQAILIGSFCCLPVWAIDYRSVDNGGAVLYDAPSQKGKKLYQIRPLTPVEAVVRLDNWTKVRDVEGTLAWIETRYLSGKRMLVVTAPKAEIRTAGKIDAPVVFEAEKWVGLEWLEPGAPGWTRVRHADGQTGFVRNTQVWGQ